MITDCDTSAAGAMAIPETIEDLPVHYIKENAFSDCVNLTSISISNTVIGVGTFAFSGCTSLSSVSFGSKLKSIAYGAFSDCSGLVSITLPNHITSISDLAFRNCIRLTNVTLSQSLSGIGNYAFKRCSSLTSLSIPETVTFIGEYSFASCSSLSSISIPDSITLLREGTFEDCTGLSNVDLGNSITSIGDSAFRNCSSLTAISLPEGLSVVEEYAFEGCSSLTDISIPDSVSSIESHAFSGCASLANLSLGNGMSSLEYSCFNQCNSLTGVSIPSSITTIGGRAFALCHNLESFYFEGKAPSATPDSFLSHITAERTAFVLPEHAQSFGSLSSDWNTLTVTLAATPTSPYSSAVYSAGLLEEETFPSAVPYNDKIENILKFAFNMNLVGADSHTLGPNGISGLPRSSLVTLNDQSYWQIQYLRRIGGNLTYTPKISNFVNFDVLLPLEGVATQMVEPIDSEWERVTLNEPVNTAETPKIFSTVEVSFSN